MYTETEWKLKVLSEYRLLEYTHPKGGWQLIRRDGLHIDPYELIRKLYGAFEGYDHQPQIY